MTSEEILKKVKDIIFNHLSEDDYNIFLFGSRAVDENIDTSDFDIGILGEESVPWSKLAKIKSEVDNLSTLKKIDIVDFQSSSDLFREQAIKKSKKI